VQHSLTVHHHSLSVGSTASPQYKHSASSRRHIFHNNTLPSFAALLRSAVKVAPGAQKPLSTRFKRTRRYCLPHTAQEHVRPVLCWNKTCVDFELNTKYITATEHYLQSKQSNNDLLLVSLPSVSRCFAGLLCKVS
jgi:hypothetical protein